MIEIVLAFIGAVAIIIFTIIVAEYMDYFMEATGINVACDTNDYIRTSYG